MSRAIRYRLVATSGVLIGAVALSPVNRWLYHHQSYSAAEAAVLGPIWNAVLYWPLVTVVVLLFCARPFWRERGRLRTLGIGMLCAALLISLTNTVLLYLALKELEGLPG